MFIDKLYDLKSNNKYVSIYTGDSLKFIFGRIVSCDEDYFILASYSPYGKYDGLILRQVGSICKVEYDDKYSQKMIKLISYNTDQHKEYLFENDLKLEILKFAQKNSFIVSIQLLNSGYDDAIGIVEFLDDDYCIIKKVDEFGNENGYSNIQYDDITDIGIDSIDEQVIKILYEINNK